jgi:hypothetical protein
LLNQVSSQIIILVAKKLEGGNVPTTDQLLEAIKNLKPVDRPKLGTLPPISANQKPVLRYDYIK